jgi:hypothetical protein
LEIQVVAWDRHTDVVGLNCLLVFLCIFSRSVVDRAFESRSGQTKDYAIGICYFSAKNATLRSKRSSW